MTHLLNVHFLQRPLKKFPVLDVLMFQFSDKLDFLHSNYTREQHVKELAVGSA